MCRGRRPIPVGAEIARSTETCKAAVGTRPCAADASANTFARVGRRERRRALFAAQMSTLYSTEGDPWQSWKLTRGPGGIVLWVPARGKQAKPKKLSVNEADPATWAAKIIDVAVDELPQVLLDALRSAGEFQESNSVPAPNYNSSCPAPCSFLAQKLDRMIAHISRRFFRR